MSHSLIVSVLKLSRATTCALAFALVFLPYYFHTRELWPSVALALPIFSIAMCMFILNDINDVERDLINHPRRPIPTGSITIGMAAIVYLGLFGISLVLVRVLIQPEVHYIYLLGFLLATNYNTIVDNLPKLKNAYVAVTVLVPVFIVNTAAQSSLVSMSITVSLFLFVLGREILMDLQDSAGDGATLAKSIPTKIASTVGFALQASAIFALGSNLSNLIRLIALVFILFLFVFVLLRWKTAANRQFLINLMQLQLLAALAFLF